MTDDADLKDDNQNDTQDKQNDDTSALKSALQKERERARSLEKQAKEYSGLGLTPQEIADLKAQREKAEEDAAKKAGEWDKLREKLQAQSDAEKKELMDRLASVEASEHEARVESGLKSALMEIGVTEEGSSLLPDILKNRAKIETVDGKRVVKIFDADGSPMLTKAGRDASFADLAAAAAEKYPSLFKATTKPGSGTPPGGNSAGSTSQTVKADQLAAMTAAQKAAYFKANPNVTVQE